MKNRWHHPVLSGNQFRAAEMMRAGVF